MPRRVDTVISSFSERVVELVDTIKNEEQRREMFKVVVAVQESSEK